MSCSNLEIIDTELRIAENDKEAFFNFKDENLLIGSERDCLPFPELGMDFEEIVSFLEFESN